MKPIKYIYKTTNNITRKSYIGSHLCRKPGYLKSYLGSGIALKDALEKYGKQNFSKEIIEYLDLEADTMISESHYIKKFNTLVPNGYNISPTGGNFKNNKLSEDHKRKISESHKGIKHSEETKKKLRQISKGKIPTNKGVPLTNEQKIKLSNSLKGHKPSNETRKKLSKSKIGNKHTKGISWSTETKKKISESVTKSLKEKYKMIKENQENHTFSSQ